MQNGEKVNLQCVLVNKEMIFRKETLRLRLHTLFKNLHTDWT